MKRPFYNFIPKIKITKKDIEMENYAKEVIPKINEKWRKRLTKQKEDLRRELGERVEKMIGKRKKSHMLIGGKYEEVCSCAWKAKNQALQKVMEEIKKI